MMEMLTKADVHMKEEVNENNGVMILGSAKLKCEDPWQNNINNALDCNTHWIVKVVQRKSNQSSRLKSGNQNCKHWGQCCHRKASPYCTSFTIY